MWEKTGIVKRYLNNPIILPNYENKWEDELVYNPAAISIDGVIFLIYRAMGEDHISRFGLARSKDGVHFLRLNYPIFFPKANYEKPHHTTLERIREKGGVEDPRAIILNNYIYLTYTAYHKKCHTAMAKIKIDDFRNMVQLSGKNPKKDLSNEWNEKFERIGLIFPNIFNQQNSFSRNSVVMSLKKDLYLLFYRINLGDIFFSLSRNIKGPWFDKMQNLLQKEFKWENERIGISTPPIIFQNSKKQSKNILFYHGVEKKLIDKKLMKIYHIGCFFLSYKIEGNKVLFDIERIKKPILSPERIYETKSEWLLPYDVRAVFSCGAIPLGKKDILIYYGAGDSNICVGKIRIKELLLEEVFKERIEVDLELFSY